MKRTISIFFKVLITLAGLVLCCLTLAFFLIRIPSIQAYVCDKIVHLVESKIGTTVKIEKVSLDLPKLIVLEHVYLEDQQRDTLLSGDTIRVDVSLLRLLSREITVHEIDLSGIHLNIHRLPRDSAFNYTYILHAFTSQKKKKKEEPATKLFIKKINLNRVSIKYKDHLDGSDINLYVGKWNTLIKEFDLNKNRFIIAKTKISNTSALLIQGIEAKLKQERKSAPSEPSSQLGPYIGVDAICIEKTRFLYKNIPSATKVGLHLRKLHLKSSEFDFNSQKINLSSVALISSKILFQQGKQVATGRHALQKPTSVVAQPEKQKNWRVFIGNLNVQDNVINYDDVTKPLKRKGIDYNHLHLSYLELNASNVLYGKDTAKACVSAGSFHEQSGLLLTKLQGDLFYGKKQAYAKNFYLATQKSLIRNYVFLRYQAVDSIKQRFGDMCLDAKFIKSKLALEDVLLFAPDLYKKELFRKNYKLVLLFDSQVSGPLKNLYISNFQLSTPGRHSHIKASARFIGLPQTNQVSFNIKLTDLSARKVDVLNFFPSNAFPPSVQFPAKVQLKGALAGKIEDFQAKLYLNSSYGSAKTYAHYQASKGMGECYHVNATLFNFDVGALLKQSQHVGRITMEASIRGVGTNFPHAVASVHGKLIKVSYRDYKYQNLSFQGVLRQENMWAKASMVDPNLTFQLHIKAKINAKQPKAKLTLNVDSVNFQQLNYTKEDIRFHGKIIAYLSTAKLDSLNGQLWLTEALVARAGERFPLDTVHIEAFTKADSSSLKFSSEIGNASLYGRGKITAWGGALEQFIHRYFSTGPKAENNYPPQAFHLDAKLVDAPLWKAFVPEVTQFSGLTINGDFDNKANILAFKGALPSMWYGDNYIDNLEFEVHASNKALTYALGVKKIKNAHTQLLNTSLNGNVKDNVITAKLNVQNAKKQDYYQVSGQLKANDKAVVFSLDTNLLILNHHHWNVSSNNKIWLEQGQIQVNNFMLTQGEQSLSMKTYPSGQNNCLDIALNKFEINNLTAIVQEDSVPLDGAITGHMLLKQGSKPFTLQTALNIQHLAIYGHEVGFVELTLDNNQLNTWKGKANIYGEGKGAKIKGSYNTHSGSFGINMILSELGVNSLEGLGAGYIKQARGTLRGNFSLTGTVQNPIAKGRVYLDQIKFYAPSLNSSFAIKDNFIDFKNEKVYLNHFTLVDSLGSTADINGFIKAKTLKDVSLALNINANDFRVMNSRASDNPLYYGQLYVGSRLQVRGPLVQPVIDGDIKINEKTKLNIALPQKDPELEERIGIVEFVAHRQPKLKNVLTSQKNNNIHALNAKGVDASLNIKVNKDAELNIVVDAANGDILQLKGLAQLNAETKDGKNNIVGTYELQEGAYNLTFNFVKRRFEIKKGGTIIWGGEPSNAQIKLTAVYVAQTAPLDLLDNQLGNVSPSERNKYKQKLPFEVHLIMEGSIMKPSITFDVMLPEGNYNLPSEVLNMINAKLSQLRQEQAELNKQVFALLLLNRFVGENPFAASTNVKAEALIRQSVSKFLSQQINNLAADLMGYGFELDVGLTSSEDYTTGALQNRTDLNITVTKRLLNDRLRVDVGSNFELEGPRPAGANPANLIGNVSAEYMLTKDGRYLLKAYQKNEYQVAIEGQVVETGLSFILTMDYNHFKEIFYKGRKKEKKNK